MPRKFFRKYLPSRESVRQNRFVARFGSLLRHPNLWHLNRRSVSGGVAAGMFAGLVPGSNPVQFAVAALLAVAFRVNLPVAVVVTLYTNPFTIVPLYVIAYGIGALFVAPDGAALSHAPEIDWSHLGASMQVLERQFDSTMSSAELTLGLTAGLEVLAVAIVALTFWGLQPRIDEYR